MFFLGFEGLLLAKAAALVAAKISHDSVNAQAERSGAPRHWPAGPPPGARLVPPPAPPGSYYASQRANYDPREVRLEMSPGGHFYGHVEIDGREAIMMIDSGATGVVIGHKLARQLGFDLRNAAYTTRVRTGGGIVMACRFTIPHMTVEGLPGRDVDAIVHERESATEEVCGGLIGASFLRQIHSEQRGDVLILRPRA